MIGNPSTEESARAILTIFANRNLRLMAGAVTQAFLINPNFTAEDYTTALSYAVEKGRLVTKGTMIRLTDSGLGES